jgi:hypothetical protein
MTTMRRPQPGEYGSVRALIETVANETFSDLFAPNPVPLEFDDEDWPLAWVAVSDEKIVGVIITNQEWIGMASRSGMLRKFLATSRQRRTNCLDVTAISSEIWNFRNGSKALPYGYSAIGTESNRT